MCMGQFAAVATPMPLIVDTDIGGGSCRNVECALADLNQSDVISPVDLQGRKILQGRSPAGENTVWGSSTTDVTISELYMRA